MISDPTKLAYREVFSVENLANIFTTISEHWVFKGLIALIVATNDFFFHPNHLLVTVVYILVFLDTLTGFMKAWRNHNVSSSGFFRFSLKLLVYMILLCVGSLLDKISPLTGVISGLNIIAVFLALTESISTLENIASIGFGVPLKIIKTLKFAQDNTTGPAVTEEEIKKELRK